MTSITCAYLTVTNTSTLDVVTARDVTVTQDIRAKKFVSTATAGTLGLRVDADTIFRTSYIYEKLTCAGTGTSLQVSNNSVLYGNLTLSGAAALGSTLTVSGSSALNTLTTTSNATIGGTLGVSGTTTLSDLDCGTCDITSFASIGGTLSVSGATTLGSLTYRNPTLVAGDGSVSLNQNQSGSVVIMKPSTSGCTVTLPDTPAQGTHYYFVRDSSAAQNCTVQRGGSTDTLQATLITTLGLSLVTGTSVTATGAISNGATICFSYDDVTHKWMTPTGAVGFA